MTPLPTVLLNLVLDTMPVARLALQDGHGRPYALPFVFARVDNSLWSPVDGKPKRHGRLARLEHIRQTPEVTVVLDHYADDWRQLWWIRLAGVATVIDGRHAQWTDATVELARKYPQYADIPMFHDEPVMIRFEWSQRTWWALDGMTGLERWLDRDPQHAPAA